MVRGRMLTFVKSLSRRHKQFIFLGCDLTLVPTCLFLAVAIHSTEHGTTFVTNPGQVLPVTGLLIVLAAALSRLLGMPETRLNTYDLTGAGRTAVFAVLLTLSLVALGRIANLGYERSFYVVFGLLFFVAAVGARVMMLHLVLALYRRDQTQCRVLIYGAGTTGLQLAQALRAHDTIEAVGFADDSPALQGQTVAGLPVLAPGQIRPFTAERGITRVLLAMPSLSPPKRHRIAQRLRDLGLEVQELPSFAQLVGEEALIDKLVPVGPDGLLGRAQVTAADTDLDHAHFTGRAILVTGAGGSIGSELCRQLLMNSPAKLVLYELSELALYTIEMELRDLAQAAGTQIVPILGSVTDARLARKVLGDHQIDVVLHAAAYKHVPMVEANPLTGLANNVLGTATIARAAQEAGVQRFILISSDKAVRPANVMGASKRLAELVVQDLANRSKTTIFAMVRFGNVLGSSGSVVPLFQDQIARGGPVTVTHHDVTRYFMTPQEAGHLVLRASSFAKGGEVFVLDMGLPKPVRDLARQLIETAGYTVRDKHNPDGDIEIIFTGLRPGEKLVEELLIGEGFLTTAHEKIFAAHEASLSEIEVAAALRGIREAMAHADDTAARAVIERWVEQRNDPALTDSGAS